MRYFYFILLLVLSVASSFAQQYQPMLKHSKEWLIKTCEFGNCLYDYYYASGDTTVQGKPYQKLWGYHYNGNFLLREDTLTQKVYTLIDFQGSNEYLLYDFSMLPGDSIYIDNPLSPAIGSAGYYQLDSIKPGIFEGISRRVFHLSAKDTASYDPYAIWIEGIGSTALINTPGVLGDTIKLAELLCVSEDNEKIYSRYPGDTCYSNPALTQRRPSSLSKFSSFYFDSRSGELHFDLPRQGYRIDLYDLSGRRLQEVPLKLRSGSVPLESPGQGKVGVLSLFDPQNRWVRTWKVIY